ncbi:rab escort protein 1 [Lolium perenne]|uniref:rab escort protein 1 n=1 Tax=Lolium perenne TaxID=4522 RepID=UPI0021F5DE0D|nr:rab escort protein 1-like [Lolium perenne]
MAAAADSSAVIIEPSSFDVVVCGTGLPESILAAACAAAGKTVLHVDPNPFYGSHFSSSVPPHALPSFLLSSASPPSTTSSDAGVVPLQSRSSLYSDIETLGTVPSEGSFAVDLVGPRLLYCAGEAVDLLHRSGGSHHVEFKSVDLLYWDHGDLFPVPASREDIFNTKLSEDAKVGLVEKTRLSAFVRLVKSHIAAQEREEGKASIPEEDFDLPFLEFLKKQKLTPKMIGVVLYAIAMADYDQEDAAADSCKTLLTTRDGMKTVALHFKSIGRFANAKGAFIYPMHGHGELPQAFCRFAAVKGALYVLRMPVTALLMDKEKQHYIGTRLATGQDILCQQLILDPSYKTPSLDLPSGSSDPNSPRKVARGICITKKSVKQNSSNVLVVFPPKSLQEQQVATLRVLQLSSNVAICPPGMFMAHLSIPCVDAHIGKLCINKAIEVLIGSQTSDGSEGHSEKTREDNDDAKQGLIWKCVYVQEITQAKSGPILSCPMPDEYLDYRNILESTEKLFVEIYPNEEFLPRNSAPQHEDDDSDSAE